MIRTAGFDGYVISFGDRLSEPANRAALAFRAALERAGVAGIEEASTSLVSAYLRFDPLAVPHDTMRAALDALLQSRDWYAAPLPTGRRLWQIPAVFGGPHGPQLAEAADAAGQCPDAAVDTLTTTRLRVQTIGFAPGMPYLGELPPVWDIPRQTTLTAQVPVGGICTAIRQLVLFPVATPTGWRHVGQTALRLFRPGTPEPFLLRPGDEVMFRSISPDALEALRADPDGGAVSEVIP